MRGTIKSNTEISTIFSQGTRFNCLGVTFIIVATSRHDQTGRVAFIAGKKNGNAVWRNAAKRRMRALSQDLGGPWNGFDVVFLAKRNILNVSYRKLKEKAEKIVNLQVRTAIDHHELQSIDAKR